MTSREIDLLRRISKLERRLAEFEAERVSDLWRRERGWEEEWFRGGQNVPQFQPYPQPYRIWCENGS